MCKNILMFVQCYPFLIFKKYSLQQKNNLNKLSFYYLDIFGEVNIISST